MSACCGSCAHGRKCEGKKRRGRRKNGARKYAATPRSQMALDAVRAMRRSGGFPQMTRLRLASRAVGWTESANPNFLYMTNRRRRNPEASTNFIYEANGKRRARKKVKIGPLNLNLREFASEAAYQRDWDRRHARDLYLPVRDKRGRFKKRRS